MRFFCIFKPAAQGDPDKGWAPTPPSPEQMEKMGKFIDESVKAGVLLATEGFRPNPEDVRVRVEQGKVTVTDGPFTEAKEVIGGFALLQVGSREEAIENARKFLELVGGGETEIHQLLDNPNLPIEKTSVRTGR